MQLLNVDTLETAQKKVIDFLKESPLFTQSKQITDVLGDVLAHDVYSPSTVPPFSRSTVDGYALIAENIQAAEAGAPVLLNLIDTVEMGQATSLTLCDGDCVYVPTGGMLPSNANAVVMVEHCESFTPSCIAIYQAVAFGDNTIQRGEDFQQGELLLPHGTQLNAGEIAILAAAGIESVEVYKPLCVSVFSTGDELISPGQTLAPGEIYDINTYSISALVKKSHMTLIRSKVLQDKPETIRLALKSAMSDSDIVLISGGSSQGKKDWTAQLLSELADEGVCTHGLALKPGKPTILAHDKDSKTLFIGLPGHPTAAMLVFKLLVEHGLRSLFGTPNSVSVPAIVNRNLASDAGKKTCIFCNLVLHGDSYIAEPLFGKSGLITVITKAKGFFMIDQNAEGVRKGAQVMVHLL